MKKYFVVGGAGFIGSHLVRRILQEEKGAKVVVYDNFSSGRRWHLEGISHPGNLKIVRGDVKNKKTLTAAMKGVDVVYHFASNPDIAKAISDPEIDFREGTLLTNNVLEAMRLTGVKTLLYASGSGVYGDVSVRTSEDFSPMLPISTYGASKLGCEAQICSYHHLFGVQAACFRFANVVGPRQTHGVAYDFIRRLLLDPSQLSIWGDGTQTKSYVYVDDIVSAMRLVQKKMKPSFNVFNVANHDFITVTQIAKVVLDVMGLKSVRFLYGKGKRGWKGDVPVVRLDSRKIRKWGWNHRYTSRQAIEMSARSIYEDAGRFGWKGAKKK